MKESIVRDKSYAFALKIVKVYRDLVEVNKEYALSRQLVRSGTAIGALIKEAQHAESKADFIHKLSISLKEANETDYWLHLLKDSNYLNQNVFQICHNDCEELIKLLTSIIKTSKANLK
jgi:four helix bundle protein